MNLYVTLVNVNIYFHLKYISNFIFSIKAEKLTIACVAFIFVVFDEVFNLATMSAMIKK